MGFGEAIRSCFTQYVGFSGRAPRSEYWFWYLFTLLVSAAAIIIDTAAFSLEPDDFGPLNGLASLVFFLPGLAVSFRRLHDIDRTAWWLLIALTGIGLLVLIVFAVMKGTEGPNRFGPDPLQGEASGSEPPLSEPSQ